MATPVSETVLGIIAPIKEVFDALKESVSAVVNTMKGFVEAIQPFAVIRFQRAINDLNAVIGQVLLPVWEEVISYVKQFSTYLFNLPSEIKDIIRFVADWMLHLGALGKILQYINSTTAGAAFIKNVIGTIESIIVTIVDLGKVAKDYLQPIFDELESSLGDMFSALNEQLNALKPLIAAGIVVAVKLATESLETFIKSLNYVVKAVTWASRQFTTVLRAIGVKIGDFNLPEVKKTNTSPEGLGAWRDAGITNTVELFRTIQNNALKLTGGGQEDPAKRTAEHTKEIEKRLKERFEQGKETNTLLKQLVSITAKTSPLGVAFQLGEQIGGVIVGE